MSRRTDTIGAELMALRDEHGVVNVKRVVEWARKHPASALHSHLEWDDTTAAELYRQSQVRTLFNVHVTDGRGDRRFVSLSIDRREGGYRPVTEVLSNAEFRSVLLEDALAELERVQRRYDHLSELALVWEAANKAKARRGRKKEELVPA